MITSGFFMNIHSEKEYDRFRYIDLLSRVMIHAHNYGADLGCSMKMDQRSALRTKSIMHTNELNYG
jgi:hypothetical protein